MISCKKFAICAFLCGVAICGESIAARAQHPHYDLLLKGGHVIDLANHVDQAMDVAVADHRIAAVAKDIPADEADKVVEVSGYYVTPGLIDIHVHVSNGGTPLDWFTPNARHREVPEGIMTDIPLRAGGSATRLVHKPDGRDHGFVRWRCCRGEHGCGRHRRGAADAIEGSADAL